MACGQLRHRAWKWGLFCCCVLGLLFYVSLFYLENSVPKIHLKSSQNPPKMDPKAQKSPQNRPKITKNQGSEGSGGPWGEVWEPWWPPGEPRSPKMCENHVRGPPWDPPLGVHFRHFLRFSGVFLWIFPRTCFYGFFINFRPPRTLKNHGFV